LDAITIEQGILVERARDVYSFSHLTLQEYLTAQYIYDHRLLANLVTEHLTDKGWKEVFLLLAGVMRGGADDLLLWMEKEAQSYINTPKLQGLLNWAEQVTLGSQGNYKPVGKRAVVIAYAYAYAKVYAANAIAIANANNIAIANANAIANTIAIANVNAYANATANANAMANLIKYIKEVEKLKIYNENINLTVLLTELSTKNSEIPDINKSIKSHQDFAKELIKTMIKSFNLTAEMVNLSNEEIKALDNYLYANYLIIQCKDAAVRVSRETWEAIEGRMLLPPGN
jgi:hypothetical protein